MKMRIIILLFLIVIISKPLLSQRTVAKAAISKNDIRSEMNQAVSGIKKEIADLENQLKTEKDPETIKDLTEQIEMLKKQLKMMQGLDKQVAGMSDKLIQQAVNEDDESVAIPKRDIGRISLLPKKILPDAELFIFIKNIQSGIERIISVAERTEALKIYDETKAQYKSTAVVANAASGCWMLGHWEKALFIMGKACMDDMNDADNLNNYAAFLINAGAEQAAIPILENLNLKYPGNSTILNNIGQAWFGLGEMENAKKFLTAAIDLYPNHSMANITMSSIFLGSNSDTSKAISFLKASIKENYDPEKEAQLTKLGYKIQFADMPKFNYPMKADPLGIREFVESMPEDYPSRIDDNNKVNEINRYVLGIHNLQEEYIEEEALLTKKGSAHNLRLTTDPQYRQQYLEPHNCPAYITALRSFELIIREGHGNSSPLITHLWLPVPNPTSDPKRVKTVREIWLECQDIWAEHVAKPLAELARAWASSRRGITCSDVDAATNAYLAKESEIRKNGTKLIKAKIRENAASIDDWVKLVLYAGMGTPPKDQNQLAMDLISQLDFTMTRKTYRDAEIYYVINMAQNFVQIQKKKKSACDTDLSAVQDDEVVPLVSPLLKINLSCEFKKTITTPVVLYKFECNALNETPKKNMKSKKDPVNKGQGHSSNKKGSSNRGPMHGGKGPFFSNDCPDTYTASDQSLAPLNAEEKDPSQFSLEYNKWGNLVGSNFQLNKDGTALADPGSMESPVDSRWSWNALASPKKGFLNKLIVK